FISRFERDDAEERRQTAAIEVLTEEVRALRAQVATLRAPQGAPSELNVLPAPAPEHK
ncbi:two pore domain potassium channel family protein, partial [Streptomyces sp. LRa12]